MLRKTIAATGLMFLAATGVALAQTPAGGGSAEGNMNSPGSVKSNTEKDMERSTGSVTDPAMARPGQAPTAPGVGAGTGVGGPAGTGAPPGTGGTAGGPGGVNR